MPTETWFEALERCLFADGGLRDVLGLTAQDVATAADLGDRMLEAGRLEDAQTIFEGCVLLEPENPASLCRLGTVRQLQGARDGAAACFRRASQVCVAPEAAPLIARMANAVGGS